MLFIYSKTENPLETSIGFNGKELTLLVTDKVTSKNMTYIIGKTDNKSVADKLSERFGTSLDIQEVPSRQFVKLDNGFIGYKVGEDNQLNITETVNLDHKPSPDEMIKITPRNLIIIITDKDTEVWTHNNNVHPTIKFNKSVIGDLAVTRLVPKWNNWKVLKFPASILLENENTGVKEKIILGFSVHKRKDTTKYHMNNIRVTEWGEKDKIFKPKNNDKTKNNDNKNPKKGSKRNK